MDNKNEKYDEQHAPTKNTDNAFVRVNKDGSPEMPETSAADNKKEDKEPKEGSLKNR